MEKKEVDFQKLFSETCQLACHCYQNPSFNNYINGKKLNEKDTIMVKMCLLCNTALPAHTKCIILYTSTNNISIFYIHDVFCLKKALKDVQLLRGYVLELGPSTNASCFFYSPRRLIDDKDYEYYAKEIMKNYLDKVRLSTEEEAPEKPEERGEKENQTNKKIKIESEK